MDIQYASHVDASFEPGHWWIRSRFYLLDRALKHLGPESLSILEIGCGTAINLHYLEAHYPLRLARLIGVDPQAQESSDGRVTIQKEIPRTGDFDFILAMDVLEHVDHPLELLRTIRLRLKSGGLLLVSVPAFQWLWTSYDAMIGHKKRYARRDLEQLFIQAGFNIQELFFLFGATFPFFVLQRLWMKWTGSNPKVFKPAHPWVNAILLAVTTWEIHSWMPHNRWFGSSIVGLARPKAAG